MTDERAKEVARKLREGQPLTMRLLNEAADELERLRTERDTEHDANARLCGKLDAKDADIARLREALKPFAKALKAHDAAYPDGHGHLPGIGEPSWPVMVGDLKRAAEVLK